MKLYRITNHLKNESLYSASAPQVRRYLLDSPEPDLLVVEEFEWDYKYQLVVLMNDALRHGRELL